MRHSVFLRVCFAAGLVCLLVFFIGCQAQLPDQNLKIKESFKKLNDSIRLLRDELDDLSEEVEGLRDDISSLSKGQSNARASQQNVVDLEAITTKLQDDLKASEAAMTRLEKIVSALAVKVKTSPALKPAVKKPVVKPRVHKGFYYFAERGDTYIGIAKKFGVRVDAILKANGLPKNANLIIGQKLYIPKK